MSVCSSVIGNSLPWYTVALFRIAPTFIVISLIALIRKEKILVKNSFSLWLRSIWGTIALLCTFYSLSRLNATDTVTIFSTTPIWVTLIMYFFFKDRVPLLFWFFVFTTFAGIYIIEKPQFQGDVFPLLVAFLGAICAGSAMVSLSFCGLITPVTVVSHYSAVALMTIFCIFFFTHSDVQVLFEIFKKYGVLLVVIGVSGTVGQICLTYAYGTGKPQWISITGLSQIIFTTIMELFIRKLEFTIDLVVGMLIVIVSISCIIGVKSNKYYPEST